jgi:putative acetyltransferase
MSAIALRPYLPADAQRCVAIFRASIDETTEDDYSDDQRVAWKSGADDVTAFAARLGGSLTLLATIEGNIVGFASLKGADSIDLLYVDPAFSRRGVGGALIGALTRLAEARGATRLTSDASDTAKPLFERQGFVGERRNLIMIDDQWLGNTTMSKPLTSTAAPATRR